MIYGTSEPAKRGQLRALFDLPGEYRMLKRQIAWGTDQIKKLDGQIMRASGNAKTDLEENRRRASQSTAKDIAAELSIHHDAAQHAINNSGRYDTFALSAPLAHCVGGTVDNRPHDTWTKTVDAWFMSCFKSSVKQFGYEGLAAPVGNIRSNKFYEKGPLDEDTVALAEILAGILKEKWPDYGALRNKGRLNAALNPPVA